MKASFPFSLLQNQSPYFPSNFYCLNSQSPRLPSNFHCVHSVSPHLPFSFHCSLVEGTPSTAEHTPSIYGRCIFHREPSMKSEISMELPWKSWKFHGSSTELPRFFFIWVYACAIAMAKATSSGEKRKPQQILIGPYSYSVQDTGGWILVTHNVQWSLSVMTSHHP